MKTTVLVVAFATALFAQQQPTSQANNVQRMNTFGAPPVFAAISANTAAVQESDKGALRWLFETGGSIESPAIAADGTIYVPSSDKNLYALSPDGKRKWVFKTSAPVDSSPAIAADGTVYVGSYDGNLYALTPEGKRKWVFTGRYSFYTPALAADGTIYAANHDMKLYALTPEGKLKWSVEMNCGVENAASSPALGTDGTVYVGGCDNQLHAFTPEGKPQWAVTVSGGAVLSSPALGADGTIYVTNKDRQREVGTLYAFTPQGKLKWSFGSPGYWPSDTVPPVVSPDGTIYYVAGSGQLFALTPEGKRKWALQGPSASPPAIGADGTIYRTAWREDLDAITPEGTLKWSLKTGSKLWSSPVIAADGTVYAGTSVDGQNKKNTLFAYRVSSRGYAAGPWPSDQARWMKHGGGQPSVEQAPVPTVAELRRITQPASSGQSGSRQVEAVAELEKRGIAFAPERFVECAEVGDGACVKLFLQAGMKAQDEAGGTALLHAVGQGHLAVAEILLENGANPDAQRGAALGSASSSGRLDIVQLLLAKGANPNPHGKYIDTPLRMAAQSGNVEVARVLLEKGADPNEQGIWGSSLRDAAERGHLEVVKLLLEKGADPNLRSAERWWTATALQAASYEGHVEVVKALLAKGANLELGDRSGRTALMVASSRGRVEIVKILLESGANIKARDDQGKTALAHAKSEGRGNHDREAVIALLETAAKK